MIYSPISPLSLPNSSIKWIIIQSELQALLDQQEKLEANNSSADNMDEDMQG